MTTLIACLLTGKGTWSDVTRLANNADWEHIYLITNDFGKQNYTPQKKDKTTLIVVNEDLDYQHIIDALKPSFATLFGEVAVNLASGTGKVHMAALAALLQSGAGIRLVVPTEQSFREL